MSDVGQALDTRAGTSSPLWLRGLQQAALRLGLEKKGFEVRAHVFPPLQHRPELAFKIRAGKPPKAGDTASG